MSDDKKTDRPVRPTVASKVADDLAALLARPRRTAAQQQAFDPHAALNAHWDATKALSVLNVFVASGLNPIGEQELTAFMRRYWLPVRSEEHTSELQSLRHLVCRLL